MPFLDYFRCCCCKKPAIEPPVEPVAAVLHVKHPTMVSFDLESHKGMRRAFDTLSSDKKKTLPPRD
jgi:hypothetical protein